MKKQETIEINGKIYPYVREIAPEEEAEYFSTSNQYRIEELKKKLSDTDYKAIKYAEGWISAEEYEPIRLERQAVRNEINQLEAEQ